MKKTGTAIIAGIVLMIISGSAFYRWDHINSFAGSDQDTLPGFRDGKYSGQSRYTYTGEPYWGSVSFTLKDGLFAAIDFVIRDSALHEPFDSRYEKHFSGNDLYIQQCRNDWKGVKTYPGKLLDVQDINKLDAISGATWSYNIFKASVKEALKKAK